MKRQLSVTIALVPLVAALLAAAPAQATSDRWSTHGPEGAWVSELVIDPQHPATVYASTSSGIFKTTDGGDRWHRLSGFPELDVRALAIAPSDPDVLYAAVLARGPNANPVYRSLDAGATWERVIRESHLSSSTGSFRATIAIDPTDPDVVYLQTFGSGILKTKDGGDTWDPANAGLGTSAPYITTIAIDPHHPQTLLAAHFSPSGDPKNEIVRSTDGASTWEPVVTGLPRRPDIAAIAFDPSDPPVAYAGGDRGLFRSTDTGVTWSPVGGLPMEVDAVEIAIAPSDPDVIYIGDSTGHVYRSPDGADSWELTDHNFGYTFVLPIAVHPSDPSTLYAGSAYSGHGVSKSVDAGHTWRTVNHGLTNTRMGWVVADPSRPNVLYAGRVVGAGIQAIQKSEDGGGTWSNLGQPASAFVIDPSDPDVLYAGSRGNIYRSDDGGLHWTLLRTLRINPAYPITSLIVSTKDPNTIYLSVFSYGLYRSTDGGLHWTRTPIGFRDEQIVDMAMNPAHPRTLYVALATRGIYKTRDGGRTWRNVLAAPTVRSITIDPSEPDRVYAGFRGVGVYATDDHGVSWNQVVDGLALHGTVSSIAVDPLGHATIYAGVYARGVFESSDFGSHWRRFSEGLEDPRVEGLAFASDGSMLHAATGGGGVFER